ncbi:MAG: tRNA lysidine(34) synthetase TilS [Phycisphaerae bacterium]
MSWDSIANEALAVLRQHRLDQRGAHWVLGVSGGPDSMLLAMVLCHLNAAHVLDWTLHAAHLHHGLRGADADADADFVQQQARNLGLTYHEDRVDVRAEKPSGASTEEFAREHREAFLQRIALKTGAGCVAVGHHADDNAETVLHRICRGTGLRGLSGMAPVRQIQPASRVKLVRPLLRISKVDIEAALRERNIEYRTDSSNESLEYTRNRLRRTVFPLLRETVNPNVADALNRLAAQAGWMSQYLADAAERVFDSLVIEEDPGRIVLNRNALRGKQRIIQAEVIRRAVSIVLGVEQDLSFQHIEAVLQLVHDSASGKEAHLPGPLAVRTQYGRVEFAPLTAQDEFPDIGTIHVRCPGQTLLSPIRLELTAEVRDIDAAKIDELRAKPHPGEEWLDYDRLQLPLFVRARRDGDRFHPLGAPGAKTLGDFLSDEKVDPAARVRTGILCDQSGPVWIMPLRIDERVKLRPSSARALRLCLRHMNDVNSEMH